MCLDCARRAAKCLLALQSECGRPKAQGSAACLSCAGHAQHQLQAAGCAQTAIAAFCADGER